MIQIEEVIIRNVIYHRIGNNDKDLVLNNQITEIYDNEDCEILKKIFLQPFCTATSTFEFAHAVDIELNPLFKFSRLIQQNKDFVKQSQNICKHLNAVSKHPNINLGELFVLKYEDIKIGNEFYEGLGIYKIENKENYIETSSKENNWSLNFKKGIGSRKLDKACLIVYTKEPFTILIIDNSKTETEYWQNEFIKMNLKNDNVNNTNHFLTLTKSYVTEQFANEFEVSKADQIDLLNRSVEYFKNKDQFEKKQFEKDVLQDIDLIKSFKKYDDKYQKEHSLNIGDSFEIASQVVKKQARVYKSVLKLDKNFHIYIHGDRQLIEQGTEKDGRKFYKIYYEAES